MSSSSCCVASVFALLVLPLLSTPLGASSGTMRREKGQRSVAPDSAGSPSSLLATKTLHTAAGKDRRVLQKKGDPSLQDEDKEWDSAADSLVANGRTLVSDFKAPDPNFKPGRMPANPETVPRKYTEGTRKETRVNERRELPTEETVEKEKPEGGYPSWFYGGTPPARDDMTFEYQNKVGRDGFEADPFQPASEYFGPFRLDYHTHTVYVDNWNLNVGSPIEKSGMGNVIVGNNQTFKNASNSVIAGESNTVNGGYDFVSGSFNDVNGIGSSITGGEHNHVHGNFGMITGGQNNEVSGTFAEVNGGKNNVASGTYSTVLGGIDNEAAGTGSLVSAGESNNATANQSTINGGGHNIERRTTGVIEGGKNEGLLAEKPAPKRPLPSGEG